MHDSVAAVLEDQPIALAVVLDEIEERLHRRVQPLPVVGRPAQRALHAADQIVDVPVQHGQVQFQLARKVLVENRFADARAVGDLVHPGRVVTAFDKDITGDDEQLAATLIAGQAVAAAV
jgi:hypothetical protein